MTDTVAISYEDIHDQAKRIARRWRGLPCRGVYGVPRGGLVPAALVAGQLGIHLVSTPVPGCLVVDDLVDSGRTWKRFADGEWYFDACYRKSWSPADAAPNAAFVPGDSWAVFPWETDEPAAPTDAVTRLLEYVGEDPTRAGLVDTPARVVRALGEMTAGYREDPASVLAARFPDRCDEMVVVSDITFTSLCEHHVLPFTGTATVGYVPHGQVVGLSKLARLVDVFARRLQVQERMTEQIADAIDEHVEPLGVGVVVRAQHSCMGCRGVRKPGATMTTSALRGVLRDKPEARAEFLTLAR